MNCFVIMPYATEFDDVYAAIKDTIDSVLASRGGSCFRLDENRPAGRITERLFREIHAAEFCVGDITGNKPNVMWEIGYAMALQKPTILLTQALSDLPFDIKDVQSIHYDRNHLSHTLRHPLKAVVLDTIDLSINSKKNDQLRERDELVGTLLAEVQELKKMVRETVRSWKPSSEGATEGQTRGIQSLQGAWVNIESGSHAYAEIVNGELVQPYCYQGDNHLTGVYYNWERTGDYWFARFAWIRNDMQSPMCGFTFLKQESIDSMTGAWWLDQQVQSMPSAPPDQVGVPATWKRQEVSQFPTWAQQFLDKVREVGIARLIT